MASGRISFQHKFRAASERYKQGSDIQRRSHSNNDLLAE